LAAPQGFSFRFLLLVDRAWRNGGRAGPVRSVSYQPSGAYSKQAKSAVDAFLPSLSLSNDGFFFSDNDGSQFFRWRGITLMPSRPYQKGALSQFSATTKSPGINLWLRSRKTQWVDLESGSRRFCGGGTLLDDKGRGAFSGQ
jgi:hypothetical protein